MIQKRKAGARKLLLLKRKPGISGGNSRPFRWISTGVRTRRTAMRWFAPTTFPVGIMHEIGAEGKFGTEPGFCPGVL